MGNNKVNYKVSKKIVIILTTLFIGGIVYINNSDAIQVKQVVSKSNAQTQSLEEQHQKIKELEEELAKEKMTMVIVTHEMAFARDVANYVVFMDGGLIVEAGTPEEVFSNAKNERTKQFLERYHNG